MNQKGLAHLVLITTTLLILAGIAIAVYLTQFTQVFKPRADETVYYDNYELENGVFSGNVTVGNDPSASPSPVTYIQLN